MSDREIIDRFYSVWFRSPKLKEFEALGGSHINVKEYKKLLARIGYPFSQATLETYIVRKDDGYVQLIGTCQDIADELGTTVETVRRGERLHKAYRKHLYFEKFYFDKKYYNDIDLVWNEVIK